MAGIKHIAISGTSALFNAIITGYMAILFIRINAGNVLNVDGGVATAFVR